MLPSKHMTLAEAWHYLKALCCCGWNECHRGFFLCSLRDLLYLFPLSYDWPPSPPLSLIHLRTSEKLQTSPRKWVLMAQEDPQGGGASKHTGLASLTPDTVMLSSALILESFYFSLGPCVVVREGSLVPMAGCLSFGHYHVCIILELELEYQLHPWLIFPCISGQ